LVTCILGIHIPLYIRLLDDDFAWKEQAMNDTGKPIPPRHPSDGMAGGFFIFAGLIIGSIIGIIYDQPSIGMVGGMATGGIIAVAIWLRDRHRG
jgi:hypothetical protein